MSRPARTLIGLGLLAAMLLLAAQRLRADSTYIGREPESPWRASALERIERFRKGDMEVRVVDWDGQPIAGANVTFAMQRHAFRFGTAASAQRLLEESPTGEQYRQKFLANFNSATLPIFYEFAWRPPERAEQSRQAALKAVEWLRKNQREIHGHVLVWNQGPGGQRSTQPLDPALSKQTIREHFERTIGDARFASGIGCWDVLNEPAENNELYDLLGREEAAEWFRRAHRQVPAAELVLNETRLCAGTGRKEWPEVVAATEELVRYLKQEEAPLHGLGVQSHQIGHLTPIPTVLQTLERLGRLELDLLITEYDVRLVPSAHPLASFEEQWRAPLPDAASPEMERLEADYLRDYLTACFSQPQVKEFTIWGFWDGDHWLHNSPLYRQDWSPKPGLKVWQELTQRTWWTEQEQLTDSQGWARVRGFLGDYKLTVQTSVGKQRVVPLSVLDWREPGRCVIKLEKTVSEAAL